MKITVSGATWNGCICYRIEADGGNEIERCLLIAMDNMRIERIPAESGENGIQIVAKPTRLVRQKGRRRRR